MTSADLGLLSYFEFRIEQETITYGDAENKIRTFMYGRMKEK